MSQVVKSRPRVGHSVQHVAYRSRMELFFKILEICRKPSSITKIMAVSNLSWSRTKQYLSFLEERGLIIKKRRTRKTVLYSITESGKVFISHMTEILRLISGVQARRLTKPSSSKKLGK